MTSQTLESSKAKKEGEEAEDSSKIVAHLEIILSKEPLDTSAYGYQPPIPKEEVQVRKRPQKPKATQPLTRGSRGGRGAARGGDRGGKGTDRGGRGGRGGKQAQGAPRY